MRSPDRATALPGGQETGPSQTGLRWRGESQVELSTGRLQLLRLFSTLLAISLIDPDTETQGKALF